MADKFKWIKEVEINKKIGIDVPDHYALRSPNGTVFEISIDNNGVFKTKRLGKINIYENKE